MPRAATSCGFWSGERRAVEHELAGVRRVDAGQHVEQAGLAGAVGPDQAVDLAVVDREGDVGRAPARRRSAWRCRGARSRTRWWSVIALAPRRLELALAHAPRAGCPPGGTASSAPARGRTAASGSPRARSACARTAPSAPAPRCSAAPPGTNESSTAPRITPQMLPMPPSTTIASTMTDSTSTKLSGLMKPCVAEKMPPEMPPNDAPIANASSFMLRGVDAHRAGGDLVLADRLPGAADARVLQPQVDDDDDEQHQHQQVVVLDRAGEARGRAMVSVCAKLKLADAERVDQRDALRAVGDVDRLRQVVQEDAHDLAEAQRDDREVVAAQLQRRRAQQHAEEARDGRADRQDHPERQVQVEVRVASSA